MMLNDKYINVKRCLVAVFFWIFILYSLYPSIISSGKLDSQIRPEDKDRYNEIQQQVRDLIQKRKEYRDQSLQAMNEEEKAKFVQLGLECRNRLNQIISRMGTK